MTKRPGSVYRPVLVIACITAFGLLSALLGDGLWDAVSWITLAVPLCVIAWFYAKGKWFLRSSSAVSDR